MKTFLKICAWCAGVAVLLGIGIAVALRSYESEITDLALRYFVGQYGISLRKESVDLSLRRAFPYCGISVGEARISRMPNTPSQAGFDIAAKHIYVSINPLTLLMDKKIDVNRIWLLGGTAKIILPQKIDTDSVSQMLVDINKIECEDFTLHIDNHIVDIEHISVGLKQDADAMSILAEGVFTVRKGKLAALHPILSMPAEVRLKMSIVGRDVFFDDSDIILADTRVGFAGQISPAKVALQGECKNGRLEKMAPFFVQQKSKLANLRGKVQTKISISGEQGINGALKIEGVAALQKMSAVYNDQKVDVRSASLNFASNDISNLQSYICNVSDAALRWNNFNAMVNAKVTGLKSPYMQLQAEVDGKLQALSDVFEQGNVRGTVAANLYGTEFEVEDVAGKLQVDNAVAVVNDGRYHLEGGINASAQSLSFPSLAVGSVYGNGIFRGKVHNYMALFRHNRDEIMHIAGTLNAHTINADSILRMKVKVKDRSSKILPQVKLRIDVSANNILLFNHLYTGSSFSLQYSGGNILIKKMISKAFDGQLYGNAKINFNSSTLTGNIYFKDIQIDKIPYLDKHFSNGSLLGKLSGKASLMLPTISESFDPNQMKGSINFTIEDGQMVNFEPIQSLAEYVKKDHLQHVRFLPLKNTFTIDNGALHIPPMEIRSTALNTYIEGTHYLNGNFDYHITLFFSELLRGKAQHLENPIKEGKTKVFLHAVRRDGKLTIERTTDIGKHIKATLQKEQESFVKAKNHKAKTPQQAVAIEYEDEDILSTSAAPTPEKGKESPRKEKGAVEITWDDE